MGKSKGIVSVKVNHLGKFDVKEFMLRQFAIAIEEEKMFTLNKK